MAVCVECHKAGNTNRKSYDLNPSAEVHVFVPHPDKCGCPCQHNLPESWEKNFLTEQPV